MLFYSDEHTRALEREGNWVPCVRYLHEKWTADKKNVSLFLSLSVTTWYTLSLDGPELSLQESEYDALTDLLCRCVETFRETFSADASCQWLFGYMMTALPLFFLHTGLEYDAIKQQGYACIEQASNSGNPFAQLLFAVHCGSKREAKRRREAVKPLLSANFDDTQEIDRYFIEILTTER